MPILETRMRDLIYLRVSPETLFSFAAFYFTIRACSFDGGHLLHVACTVERLTTFYCVHANNFHRLCAS